MWSICFGSAGINVDRPVVQVIKRLEKNTVDYNRVNRANTISDKPDYVIKFGWKYHKSRIVRTYLIRCSQCK